MALRVDVEPGQKVQIGDKVTVTLESKSGRRARLRIDSSEPVVLSEPTGEPPQDKHVYQRKTTG